MQRGQRRRLLISMGLAAGICFSVSASLEAQSDASSDWNALTLRDPAKVVTAEACGECHALEKETWLTTPHATGFKTLHRRESAETIAGRMGFKLIKRESLCLKCHYTAQVEKEQLRAVSGVSCESCHGAGRDWIDIHNNYGPGADVATETEAHREQRIDASRAAGMRRPSEIYDTAKSCFECHTVPEERLVNVGGHSTGSLDFELVERSQGEIRHNFLGSLTGGSRDNRVSSPERRRLLYLAGRLLDLEYSLRGLAVATREDTYSKAMSRRIRTAVAEVRAIAASAGIGELDDLLQSVRSADLTVGQSQALEALAATVGTTNRQLLAGHDGSRLAALDPLIAGQTPPDQWAESEDQGPDDEVDSLFFDPPEAEGEVATTGTTAAVDDGIPAEGPVNRWLRPRSNHRSLGPGACSGCHGDQNAWWFDDRHFASAEPFFDQRPEAVRIARLYGVRPGSMARGDALCMDCHGSVVSGKERREVLDGVGCESCHGSAADWLEPHKEGDASLGRNRPGFVAALGLGKRDLGRLDVRAETCASCHYVTDPRLLSAGHPSGEGWDFAAAVSEIVHWDQPVEPRSELTAAWRTVQGQRGPVPTVRLARLPSGSVPTADGAVSGGRSARRSPRPARTLNPRPRGGGIAPVTEEVLDLGPVPPFPVVDPDASVEEVLLILRQRLELLYGIVAAAEGEP